MINRFRGDLVQEALVDPVLFPNTTTIFSDRIYFGQELDDETVKDPYMYFRGVDNPNGVNSFVRMEFNIIGNQNTGPQDMIDRMNVLENELLVKCGGNNLIPRIKDFKGRFISSIQLSPSAISPGYSTLSKFPKYQKEFLFYYDLYNG